MSERRANDPLNVARTLQAIPHCAAPLVHLTEVAIHVQCRILFQRDDQRGLDQIKHRLGQLGDLPEALPGQGGMGQNSSRLHAHSASF